MKNPGMPKIAVITGRHGFHVPQFHHVFRSLSDADVYIQHMEMFSTSSKNIRESYDVVLFFHMFTETPSEESDKRVKTTLEELGETPQGLFLLHHSILAYPKWKLWSELVGMEDRKFDFYHDVSIHVEVARADHPITQGLRDWDMIDETYVMNDAGEDSEILLTTEHLKSMKTIAWTRRYKKSRVFCFQSGHDNQTWMNHNFREVLRRGIQWCASRI